MCTANAKGRILYMSQAYRIWFKKRRRDMIRLSIEAETLDLF